MSYATLTHLQGTAYNPAGSAFAVCEPVWPSGKTRDGKKGGKGAWRWGKKETIYLSLHCHHQNDSCIKMGSYESHFNVSVGSAGQSHKTVSTNHNHNVNMSTGYSLKPSEFSVRRVYCQDRIPCGLAEPSVMMTNATLMSTA